MGSSIAWQGVNYKTEVTAVFLYWEILKLNGGFGVDVWVLAEYHKCHENFLSSVLEWFHHKQAIQICPKETLVRLPQHCEMPFLLHWSETCMLKLYIIQTSCCSQLPQWINWVLALLIRLFFEITCCNFGTGCLTVGQNAAKVVCHTWVEYVTPGYIRSMHLHMEQLNENFRKN